MSSGSLRGRGDGEQSGAGAHDERAADHAGPATPTGLAEFIEEEKAPEDAEQAVGVPEREGDAQADVANRKNGERVGNGLETAGEDGPND